MAARAASARETGFVLVAVVVFVLALTILMLTLYGLSSYEAQFFQRSADTEQAFQAAQGGLERARFLLCSVPPYALGSVRASAQSPWAADSSVIGAVAIQSDAAGLPDSVGPVRWVPDSLVTIRVTAQVNGVRRMVEARFAPTDAPSFYRQVMAVYGSIAVATGNRNRTVFVQGPVCPGSGGTAWQANLAPGSSVTLRPGTTQSPDLGPYFAAHPAGAADGANLSGSCELQASEAGVPKFYCGDADSAQAFYLAPNLPMQVTVRGLVVLLFPGGVRFDSLLTVHGRQDSGMPNCLMIVAGPAGADHDATYPDAGIRFRNGLEADVPVILVSSGRVVVQERDVDPGRNLAVSELSIFAHDVQITGPRTNWGSLMSLSHMPGGVLDAQILHLLADQGALPGLSSSHGLALVRGSWRASNP